MGHRIWTPICLLVLSTLIRARCLPMAPRHRHHISLHQHAATMAAAERTGLSALAANWKPTLDVRSMVPNTSHSQVLGHHSAGQVLGNGNGDSLSALPLTDAQNAEYVRIHRKKQKEARLNQIQRTIMEALNVPERRVMNSSIVQQGEQRLKEFYEKFYTNPVVNQPFYQNFLPSCDIPRNTDDEMWNSAQHYHLYFDLGSLQPQPGNSLYILSAKLKLLKLNEGDAMKKDSEPCLESILAKRPTITDLTSDDERVRVTVHQYTKPLKKGKASKTKIMDSQMVPSGGDILMEFSVRNAVRQWARSTNNRDKNFGFLVEVEDTEKHRRPAAAFFLKRECSSNAGKEIRLGENQTTTLPVLEIATLEYPESKSVPESLKASNQGSSQNGPSPRKKKTDPVSDRSLNGREDEPALAEFADDIDASDYESFAVSVSKIPTSIRKTHQSGSNSEAGDSSNPSSRHYFAQQSKNGQARDRHLGESQQAYTTTAQNLHLVPHVAIKESPLATLATLEDVDYMGSEDDEDESDSFSKTVHKEPESIFVRRLILSGLHTPAGGDRKL